MHIGFNKTQFYSKMMLIFIVISIIMILLFYPHPIRFSTPVTVPEKIFLYFIAFFIFIGFISVILQLLFLPKSVDIFEEEKYLKVSFWLFRPLQISFEDLSNYYCIVITYKATLQYRGIVIQTSPGIPLLFNNSSLEDYTPIQDLLNKLNIPFNGDKDFNLLSYYANFLKSKK